MTSPASARRSQAIGLLLLATVVWGLSFPVGKALGLLQERLVPGGDTWFATTCMVGPRFLLAAVVLVLVRPRSFWRLTPLEWRQGLGLGFFASLGMLFQMDGLQHTAASVSAFLTQVYAVLIPLWVAWRRRVRPHPLVMAAGALVLVGVAVLSDVDWRQFRLGRGEIETLIGALFFMGQILWLERPEFAGNSVSRVTTLMFVLIGAGFSVGALALAPEVGQLARLAASPLWVGLTLVLTGACTIFCFTVMNAWQPKISATEAGLIYSLEPVSAAVMACFLPGLISRSGAVAYANEQVGASLVVGGLALTAANVLVQLPAARGAVAGVTPGAGSGPREGS